MARKLDESRDNMAKKGKENQPLDIYDTKV